MVPKLRSTFSLTIHADLRRVRARVCHTYFTALFSLLDKEKQQIALLSHVNLIPPQNKEVGQGASVQE